MTSRGSLLPLVSTLLRPARVFRTAFQQVESAVSVHAANFPALFGRDVACQGVLGPVKRCSCCWIGLLLFNT